MTTRFGVATSQWDGAHRVYGFSDSTGLERRNSIGIGTYQEDIEASCDEPNWAELTWTSDLPADAEITFSVATANQRNKLDAARGVEIAAAGVDAAPINISDVLDAAGVVSRRFIRIEARLKRATNGQSPILRRFAVLWACD